MMYRTPNASDQWLAATGLSTPPGFIASPLHRVVRGSGPPLQTAARTTAIRSLTPSGPAWPESGAHHRERRGIRVGTQSRRCWGLLHLPILPLERPDREQPPIAPGIRIARQAILIGKRTRKCEERPRTAPGRRVGVGIEVTGCHNFWMPRTTMLSSSRPTGSPYRRTLSRVCSNAWFGVSAVAPRSLAFWMR